MFHVYIEAECPKLKDWYLCEQDITHQTRTKADCIQELITNQVLQDSCRFTTITLTREAMEKLDDQHFVLSFPQERKVQLTCNQKAFTSLQGSYLATIPIGCNLKTEEFTIANVNDEMNGQPLKIMKIPYDAEQRAVTATHVNLNSINLQGLHSIQDQLTIQNPVQLEKVHTDALYHTTIPFYGVLLSASVLVIIVTIRRYLRRCANTTKKDQKPQAATLENNDSSGELPATFSLNVLK